MLTAITSPIPVTTRSPSVPHPLTSTTGTGSPRWEEMVQVTGRGGGEGMARGGEGRGMAGEERARKQGTGMPEGCSWPAAIPHTYINYLIYSSKQSRGCVLVSQVYWQKTLSNRELKSLPNIACEWGCSEVSQSLCLCNLYCFHCTSFGKCFCLAIVLIF